MAAYSGKEGAVLLDASQDLEELREWKLDYEVNTHPYFSRDGAGAQQTIKGCEHGSGLNLRHGEPPCIDPQRS